MTLQIKAKKMFVQDLQLYEISVCMRDWKYKYFIRYSKFKGNSKLEILLMAYFMTN